MSDNPELMEQMLDRPQALGVLGPEPASLAATFDAPDIGSLLQVVHPEIPPGNSVSKGQITNADNVFPHTAEYGRDRRHRGVLSSKLLRFVAGSSLVVSGVALFNGVDQASARPAVAHSKPELLHTESAVATGAVLKVHVPEAVGGKTIVGQLTADKEVAPGFVTAYDCDKPMPVKSDLNFMSGAASSNRLIATTSQTGDVCFYTSQQTDLVVDVFGIDNGITTFANERNDTRDVPPPTTLPPPINNEAGKGLTVISSDAGDGLHGVPLTPSQITLGCVGSAYNYSGGGAFKIVEMSASGLPADTDPTPHYNGGAINYHVYDFGGTNTLLNDSGMFVPADSNGNATANLGIGSSVYNAQTASVMTGILDIWNVPANGGATPYSQLPHTKLQMNIPCKSQ
jgi:hypothetical protein